MALHDHVSKDIQIGMVAEPLAWDHWPEAKALLDPALARSDEGWNTLESQLRSSTAQLWAVQTKGGDLLAAAVTRRVGTREADAVEVFLVGGTGYDRWIAPLSDLIGMAAKADGCTSLRAYGRPGWRDVLGKLDWRVSFVGYEKAL